MAFDKSVYNIEFVDNPDNFMGVKIDGERVKLFLPRFFSFQNNKYIDRKNIIAFLKSISLSKNIHKLNIVHNDGDDGDFWPIDSFIWIIRDYKTFGFYRNRSLVYSNDNKGKIDWRRTVKVPPKLSNDNIVFDKVVSRRNQEVHDEIAVIYNLCLKHSMDKIGWLFNYHIDFEVSQKQSISEMRYCVKREMSKTFDDYKKLRFQHILKILNHVDGNNVITSSYTYGTNSYYTVYENMIDKFFSGVVISDKRKYYPNGSWFINGQMEAVSSFLRPDTIILDDTTIYIIDAKMYKFGHTFLTKDLPQTNDMQKQITYGDYIRNNLGGKVKNIFMLPYNSKVISSKFSELLDNLDDSGNFAYIGFAKVNWTDKSNFHEHYYIYTFLIDFNFLLTSYQFGNSKYLELLCAKVNNL